VARGYPTEAKGTVFLWSNSVASHGEALANRKNPFADLGEGFADCGNGIAGRGISFAAFGMGLAQAFPLLCIHLPP